MLLLSLSLSLFRIVIYINKENKIEKNICYIFASKDL